MLQNITSAQGPFPRHGSAHPGGADFCSPWRIGAATVLTGPDVQLEDKLCR